MENEKKIIPLQKRIIYGGDVFDSLMEEKGWSATEAADFVKGFRIVNAVEVVHGQWIRVHEWCGVEVLKCSACGKEHPRLPTAYCCDCGAKMDGDGNG